MIVNILLIIVGTMSLVLGVSYFKREKKNLIRTCILTSSVCVFLWDMGYALMGLWQEETLCYIFRAIGLAGIIFFTCNEAIFVHHVTGTLKNVFKYLGFGIFVWGIVVLYFIAQPYTVNFVQYKGRTAYMSNACFARTFESIFVACLFLLLFCMGIVWFMKSKKKRDREIIFILIFAHCSLIISIIPDTVLPILGIPSFPSSCFGAAVCFLGNLYAADKYNLFNLSLSSTYNYIYHNVDSAVVVIDEDYRIHMANDFACKFLGLESQEGECFYHLFKEINSDTVLEQESFCKLLGTLDDDQSIRLSTVKNNTTCAVKISKITDKYNDTVCIICMIYDLTKEEKLFNEVNDLKNMLLDDLHEKTRELEALTLQAVTTIAATIDAKDLYTKGHSLRVSEYSETLARSLGWKEEDIERLKYAALLHDIGKIGVPDSILKKPDSLTAEEYEILKQHTTIGADILKEINQIEGLDLGAKYHHERYNGSGYPTGLVGEEIPLFGRVIAIADAYDAMDSNRVYRKALTKEKIEEELLKGRGSQFDPAMLDAFYVLFKTGKLEPSEAAAFVIES